MTVERAPTLVEIDIERYSTAMLALGYAFGMVLRMVSLLQPVDKLGVAGDVDWLRQRVYRVLDLNDISEAVKADEG